MGPDPSVGRGINEMIRDKKERKKYANEGKLKNMNNFEYRTALINLRWFSVISPMTKQSLQIKHNSTYLNALCKYKMDVVAVKII